MKMFSSISVQSLDRLGRRGGGRGAGGGGRLGGMRDDSAKISMRTYLSEKRLLETQCRTTYFRQRAKPKDQPSLYPQNMLLFPESAISSSLHCLRAQGVVSWEWRRRHCLRVYDWGKARQVRELITTFKSPGGTLRG